MSKLTYEKRIEIYNKSKNGESLTRLSRQYGVGVETIRYLVKLIDKHGYGILRTTKNRKFSTGEKERIINRVLLGGEAANAVSIDEGLVSKGILYNWIKKYKEDCYNIAERKRGNPAMKKQEIKPKENETLEERTKRVEKENECLRAEVEYLKN